MKRVYLIFAAAGFCGGSAFATTATTTTVLAPAENTKARISELFIWKTSEELKLNANEEKAFTDYSRALNLRRLKANDEIQDSIKKLSEAKTTKERTLLLTSYRKVLSQYNQLQIEEFDKMSKILGTDKTAQYFVYKNEFTNKLKNLLQVPESQLEEKKARPAPRLIEDK